MVTYPEMAACKMPGTGELIMVKRGERGYWPFVRPEDKAAADRFNERRGVTPAIREAMLVGSMFGWRVPGADLDKAGDLYPDARPLAAE